MKECPTCHRPFERSGRMCASCQKPIKRRHRWHVEGCVNRHDDCSNPTLEMALEVNQPGGVNLWAGKAEVEAQA